MELPALFQAILIQFLGHYILLYPEKLVYEVGLLYFQVERNTQINSKIKVKTVNTRVNLKMSLGFCFNFPEFAILI